MVNGPTGELGIQANNYNEVNGYVIDISKESAEVMSKFNTIDGGFSSPHDVAVSSDGGMIFVAEINPPAIHKFVRKTEGAGSLNRTKESMQSMDSTTKSGDSAKQAQEVIASGSNSNLLTTEKMIVSDASGRMERHHPTITAVLVALLMSFFILLTLALAMAVARRRRRRGNVTNVAGSLSIGQPNELVYRKLVDSSQQLAERQQP